MKYSTVNYGDTVKKANDLLSAGTPMIVFDMETTGIRKNVDKVVSLSAIKLVWQYGIPVIQDQLELLIDPQMPIPAEASKVNRIYDSDVAGKPTIEESFPKIYAFFGEHPFLCGYNSVRFDQPILERIYQEQSCSLNPICHLDVYTMAKEKMDLQNYKLETVAHELGEDGGLKFHASSADVIATYRVFSNLRDEYGNTEPEPEQRHSVRIYKAKYWEGPSHKLQRIYVLLSPRLPDGVKVYYDIFLKEWKSVGDLPYPLQDIRLSVLDWAGVANESDLVKALKTA